MSEQKQLEVYRTFNSGQERHAYFMMAAAGAAIAFAVTQTETAAWSTLSFVWLAAIASWGISFYFGGRHMAYVRSNQFANINLLKTQEQAFQIDTSMGGGASAAMTEGIRTAIEANSTRSVTSAKWQIWAFIGGALIYIAWHVAAMVARSAT